MALQIEDNYIFDLDEVYSLEEIDPIKQPIDLMNVKIDIKDIILVTKMESKLNEWVPEIYFFEENCNFYPFDGHSILEESSIEGDLVVMSESRNSKRKDLEETWKKNFERIMKANQASDRAIFESESEMIEFISNCEKIYKISTKELMKRHVEKGYEGNVDERRWFRFAKTLEDNGHSFN